MKSSIITTAVLFASLVGIDGYYFKQRENSHRTIILQLQEFESRAALQQHYIALSGDKINYERVGAFTTYRGQNCTIFIVKPEIEYKPQQVGHEVMHCVYGAFHSK